MSIFSTFSLSLYLFALRKPHERVTSGEVDLKMPSVLAAFDAEKMRWYLLGTTLCRSCDRPVGTIGTCIGHMEFRVGPV